MRAIDLDSGDNGRIVYSILEDSVAQYVHIQPDTGTVLVSTPLDYERTRIISFTIQAEDAGSPSRKSTVPATIHVIDVNDEEPTFLEKSYVFSLRENNQPGALVGHVSALDTDSAPYNLFVYKMIDAYSTDVTELFAIDPRAGKIIAKKSFDREDQAVYRCTVAAIDQEKPTLRSEADVTIRIEDENDNFPVIDYPGSSTYGSSDNNTFYISSGSPIGHGIVRMVARDPDEGDNARLLFNLANTDPHEEIKAFRVNQSSGVLSTAIDFSGVAHRRQYRVVLTAHDSGSPPKSSAVDVIVVVDPSIAYDPGQGRLFQTIVNENLTLVIVVVSVSGFIVIVLLIAIFVIKSRDGRRDNSQQDVYHCRLQEQKAIESAGGGGRYSGSDGGGCNTLPVKINPDWNKGSQGFSTNSTKSFQVLI